MDSSLSQVILDTNILVAAIVFPESMSREIMEMAEENRFQLILPEWIKREVEEIINRDFPSFTDLTSKYLSIAHRTRGLPPLQKVKECIPILKDIKDSPVLASVLEIKPDYFVTNDIQDLHTDRVKAFLKDSGVKIFTPYGFLKEYGKR